MTWFPGRHEGLGVRLRTHVTWLVLVMPSFNPHTGEAETGKCSVSVRDLDFRNTAGRLTSDLYMHVHTCALLYVYLPYERTATEIFTEKGMSTENACRDNNVSYHFLPKKWRKIIIIEHQYHLYKRNAKKHKDTVLNCSCVILTGEVMWPPQPLAAPSLI